MKLNSILFLVLLLSSLAQAVDYPPTRTVDVKETFHGVEVKDPYRWLEEMKSDEVHQWVLKQNELTRKFLDQVPERSRIRKRLAELWNFEKYAVPAKHGNHYFYEHNSGVQNQFVHYVSEDLKKPGQVLLDPNTLSKDNTTSIRETSPSHDGNLYGYGISQSGSDWLEWKIRDVKTGKDLPDSILRSKHIPLTWAHDNGGFYYLKFEESGVNRVYFHLLGTPQSKDKVIFEHPTKKEHYIVPEISEDGRYLILFVRGGSSSDKMVYFADLKSSGGSHKFSPVFEKEQGNFIFLGNLGTRLLFMTSVDAPRGRIVSVDVGAAPYTWKTLVPETKDMIEDAKLVHGRLVVLYLKDAVGRLKVFDESGKFTRDIKLPVSNPGIYWLSGKQSDNNLFFRATSVSTPNSIFSLDPVTGRVSQVWKLKLPFDPSQFKSTQVFFKSKDGTRVPMMITHKKGLRPSPSTPTLLYGYGGFNVAILPAFRTPMLQWMEMGGIYAYANIRGGSEYGEQWHQGGIKTRKQNVFDDFIAAAEWLIKNKFTSTPKLAIMGGSNGGLLVGACMTQRPELFGAAIPVVGVLDMLRFQLFTEGPEWTVDYGELAKADEFKALLAYSPYHNIQSGRSYPPTLIVTAETDDRVVPAHSYKYAARLQAAQKGGNPILLRVETRVGHGSGKPTSKAIEEYADIWSFLIRILKMSVNSGR